jgi:hypothetical protein
MKKLINISQMNMFLHKSILFIAILSFSQINIFAHGKVDVKTITNNGSTTKYTSKAHVSKTGILANRFSSVHTQNPCWEGSNGVALEKENSISIKKIYIP